MDLSSSASGTWGWAATTGPGVVLAAVLVLAAAVAVDYVAISQFGVSDFCISQAYLALIPAYAALFAAGRWFAGQYQGETWLSLGKLMMAVVLGFALSEVISSGSFYALSGTSTALSWGGFAEQLVKYSPHGLYIMSFYLTVAAFLHVAVRQIQHSDVSI